MEFGGVIKALRQRKGWSQEEFADQLHINQSDVSKFENDVKAPDMNMFVQISQVTQAPEVLVAFLMGVDGLTIMQNLATMLGGFIKWV